LISEQVRPVRSQPTERGLTISLGTSWHRLGLLATLALSACLEFFGLERLGYANGYYAAAVKSMTESWHNFFFNSFDPGGFVTIDKPPLGFWFQVASAKIFGFSGVAILLPQALAGVLSVALLYSLVARKFGKVAGLLSALALAVTPISVVTARDNTIDTTLVLFLLLGAWAVTRAIETGKLRWLLLCAVFVGLGFNVKMLQAFLVVPAFGLMYLVGARIGIRRKIVYLLAALAVLAAVSLSWVTAVDLTPAGQRPWVDSTTNNSELTLALGYNGLQRLTGNSSISGSMSTFGETGFGPGGVQENGAIGALRLLDTQLGGQIGWLLPLAVIGFLAAAWQTRRRGSLKPAGRWPLDERQSTLVMWGAWLLTTGAFFSVAGFYHTYYLVMVAPAIAALAGIGVVSLWQIYRSSNRWLWPVLPLGLAAAAVVQIRLLNPYPSWSSWLAPLIIGGCALAGLVLIAARVRPRLCARVAIPFAALGALVLLAAPAAWAADTLNSASGGAILHAGPTATGVTGGFGGPSGGFAGFRGSSGNPGSRSGGGFQPPSGRSGSSSNGFGPPPGAANGGPPNGTPPPGAGNGGTPGRFPGNGSGGNRAGGLGTDTAGTTLVRYLEKHQETATYLVATSNSGSAESIILATGKPVMSLGGFSGNDPILTASKLATLAKEGVVKYFLVGGGGPGGGGALTMWIQQHSRLITVGGTLLYEYTG
jgi:4-amino-4-deoxy-L-arabinose transferase-like glycosyltransferase